MHLIPPPDKLPECIHISDFHSLTRKDLRQLKDVLVVGDQDNALAVVVPFAMYMATQRRLVDLLSQIEALHLKCTGQTILLESGIKDIRPV